MPHVTADWFPKARKDRRPGSEGLAPAELIAPRTRLFPFHMSLDAVTRRSLSTPLLQGPMMIRSIEFYPSTVADPPNVTIEIGYATTRVTEDGVAITVQRPYTVLTELIDPFGVINDNAGAGFPLSTLPSTRAHFQRTLDMILTINSGHIVVAAIKSAVGGFPLTGVLRILEDISPEAARNFL